MRRAAVLTLVLGSSLFVPFLACEDESTTQPQFVFDAGPQPTVDATTPDTAAPDVAVPDTGVDAADAAPPTTLLFMGISPGVMPPSYATSFDGTSWANVKQIGTDEYGAVGGGVTILPSGRGLAVARSNSAAGDMSATWSKGTWSTLAPFGTSPVSYVSPPIATPTGALVVDQSGTGLGLLRVYGYDDATSTWSAAEPTALPGSNQSVPAIATTQAGNAFVVGASSMYYMWTQKTGGTWSAPAPINGVSKPFDDPAAVVATRRAGSSQIVAAFTHAIGLGTPEVVAAVFDGNAWSAPVPIGTDVARSALSPFALVAQSDGTVALAYATETSKIKLGFWNGTTWSSFQEIPGVTVSAQYGPLGLARGIGNASLELVFLDANIHVAHTRLTNTWSAPKVIDPDHEYVMLAIASGT